MSRVEQSAALACAAREVVDPSFEWPDAERTIRSLRRSLRLDLAGGHDIRYVQSGGITLLPIWDEERLVEYEVLVPVGTIKP